MNEVDAVYQSPNEWVIQTDNERNQDTTSELLEVFKGHCDAIMPVSEFSQSVERHGLIKSAIGGVMYIRNIKLKSMHVDATFVEDVSQGKDALVI